MRRGWRVNGPRGPETGPLIIGPQPRFPGRPVRDAKSTGRLAAHII
jgi:hypothetical protein